jgi:hypothetical protein
MAKVITRRALLLRIERQFKTEGKKLKKCRADARDFAEIGPYFVVCNGRITASKLELEDFARKIGVLDQFEKLESEEK